MQIYVSSDFGGSASDLSEVTSHVIEETIAEIIIELSTTLSTKVKEGCDVSVINSINVRPRKPACHLSTTLMGNDLLSGCRTMFSGCPAWDESLSHLSVINSLDLLCLAKQLLPACPRVCGFRLLCMLCCGFWNQ